MHEDSCKNITPKQLQENAAKGMYDRIVRGLPTFVKRPGFDGIPHLTSSQKASFFEILSLANFSFLLACLGPFPNAALEVLEVANRYAAVTNMSNTFRLHSLWLTMAHLTQSPSFLKRVVSVIESASPISVRAWATAVTTVYFCCRPTLESKHVRISYLRSNSSKLPMLQFDPREYAMVHQWGRWAESSQQMDPAWSTLGFARASPNAIAPALLGLCGMNYPAPNGTHLLQTVELLWAAICEGTFSKERASAAFALYDTVYQYPDVDSPKIYGTCDGEEDEEDDVDALYSNAYEEEQLGSDREGQNNEEEMRLWNQLTCVITTKRGKDWV